VPYEFWTEDDVPVRLHDMAFLGVSYAVDVPSLTLRFAYEEPRWTPPEARATPIAIFRFDGVRIWGWEDDRDVVRDPAELRRQVGSFDFHEDVNCFSLGTSTTTLTFSADLLEVTLEPAD